MSALRCFFALLAVAAHCAGGPGTGPARGDDAPKGAKTMYGLIGKITAAEGKRDELIAVLLQGTREMPGCLSYVVARDPADASAVWVTEVWQDEASHKASLALPAVREAIAKGKPLIAKFDQRVVTEPVGGHGLAPAKRR
jgi:quinol monooxygenase YgiN